MVEYDAIVLGAGDAGLEVASAAASAGMSVAVAYREPYLGTCLNTGCNPSKFLIERARIARQAYRPETGVRMQPPVIDLAAMVDEKDAFIAAAREEAFEAARSSEYFHLHHGLAEFVDSQTVHVEGAALSSRRIFIATGARPSVPTIPGLEDIPYLTNESVMNLREVPPRLAILGGGYIACELGQTFARFGSDVTIIQRAERICRHEEPELSEALQQVLEGEGLRVLPGHQVTSVSQRNGAIHLQGDGYGHTFEVEATHLLVATGRSPNTATLHLDRAGVETDDAGFVQVDAQLQTSAPGIWAIGDVNGQQPFTRVAQLEGQLAFQNAFTEEPQEIDRHVLPHAIFTDPELGSVGLTEDDARASGLDVEAGVFPAWQIPRARLAAEEHGEIKLVVDRHNRQILGCHVLARNAAELVFDAAIVMRLGGTIDDLGHTVGTYPTMQEGIEGSSRALAHSLHHERKGGLRHG